jgi:exonuclease SbcC
MSGNLVVSEALFAATEQDVLRVRAGWGDGQGPEQRLLSPADGETFLASLSLALGMVELAGRGGGRLDALFLDEGFGALDANALSEALDALGRQAETGRLVAVISHLRSVAEAMDRVLAVTFGPSGSQAHWLGGDERAELIAEDIEASLLT